MSTLKFETTHKASPKGWRKRGAPTWEPKGWLATTHHTALGLWSSQFIIRERWLGWLPTFDWSNLLLLGLAVQKKNKSHDRFFLSKPDSLDWMEEVWDLFKDGSLFFSASPDSLVTIDIIIENISDQWQTLKPFLFLTKSKESRSCCFMFHAELSTELSGCKIAIHSHLSWLPPRFELLIPVERRTDRQTTYSRDWLTAHWPDWHQPWLLQPRVSQSVFYSVRPDFAAASQEVLVCLRSLLNQTWHLNIHRGKALVGSADLVHRLAAHFAPLPLAVRPRLSISIFKKSNLIDLALSCLSISRANSQLELHHWDLH